MECGGFNFNSKKGRRTQLPKMRQKRITLSDEAFTALDNMVGKINFNFHGGSIDYSQLMGWIVRFFETASFESKIDTIRAAHFDELVYMRHLVAEEAKARRDGGVVGATPDLMKKLIEQKRQTEALKSKAQSKLGPHPKPDSHA